MAAGSPQMNQSASSGLAANQIRPAQFPQPNNVSNNLYIPANKQRSKGSNAAATVAAAAAAATAAAAAAAAPMTVAQGSPRPLTQAPTSAQVAQLASAQTPAQAQAQAQLIQKMISQGIPVNVPQQRLGSTSRPSIPLPGEQPIEKPQQQPNQPQQRMPGGGDIETHLRRMSEQISQSNAGPSLLSQVTWTPSPEYDQALKEKLSSLQRTLRPTGRSTLSQGLGVNRVISDVLVEKMPEALVAMAEEAVSGVGDDEEGDQSKADKGTALPGQKKRKVAELASTVDPGFEIDREVEAVGCPSTFPLV